MRELLVLLAIIAVIAIIVYLRRQSAKDAEQRKIDEFRQMQAKVAAADRAAAVAAPPVARAEAAPAPSRGLLQDAADRAAGLPYERAADQIDAQTDELARARVDAERAADRLSDQAGQALAAVQTAAAAHGGAVPGDGTRDCPPDYPVKGNMPSQRYHEPGQLSYNRTIPEVCFQSAAAAESAGFTAAQDNAGMRREAGASPEVVEVKEVAVVEEPGGAVAEAAVADEIRVDDGRGGAAVAEAMAVGVDNVPPGAVRGDGSRDCPPTYPIKASTNYRRYHMPGTAAYADTTPELCFSSLESAEGAGYSPMA